MLSIKQFLFNPVQENTYVIYDDQGWCAIVDPGCYFEQERQALLNFVTKEKLRPKYLLNTHCHLDHVFGNRFVAATWELPLHLHALEQPVLERAPESGMRWGLPFENYTGKLHFLEEGDQVQIGNEVLDILFTPGHSPGSISFYHKAGGWLLSGDVLFRGSIGRTDLPGGDFDQLISSIHSKLYPLPDDTEVYSGHGPVTTLGWEKKHNPFLNQTR